jgi:hypothetical protein
MEAQYHAVDAVLARARLYKHADLGNTEICPVIVQDKTL